MKDKNGRILKIGDYATFMSRNPKRGIVCGKILEKAIDQLLDIILVNHEMVCRAENEVTKISDEEAMLYILENS